MMNRRDVVYWHECDIAKSRMDVRFRGKSGRAAAITGMTESDLACVKTHTSAKCKKYNSPVRRCAARPQHDLTLTTRNSSEIFYARSRRSSFHTAKTHFGHRRGN
jgi:hypothetical protein